MVSLVVGAIMTVKELAYYGINGAEETAFEIFVRDEGLCTNSYVEMATNLSEHLPFSSSN